MGSLVLRRVLAAVLFASLAATASAQEAAPVRSVCTLDATHHVASLLRSGGSTFEPCAAPTAVFEVDAPDLPAEARRALDAALAVWACRIASPVPIRIEARWTDLPTSRLASAGPRAVRDADPALPAATWIPSALADALAGRDLLPDVPDIEMDFNRVFPTWHFDLGTPPSTTDNDFATVALHEVGHGLGLIGSMTVEDGLGRVEGPGGGDTPLIYDRFTLGPLGRLLDASVYPRPSLRLAKALTTNTLFDGRAVRQSVAWDVTLYAPRTWSGGASYDHLDEEIFPPGSPSGLMTPFLARGERVTEPGVETCAMLADLGWRLAGSCADLVGPLPTLPEGIQVRVLSRNPFRQSVGLQVGVDQPAHLRVWLVDALGRRVASLRDEGVIPGFPIGVTVEGRGLAAGVYYVVVQAGGETVTVPLTRLP